MSDPYASIARPADPYAGIATRAAPGAKRRSMADEVGGFMANVNRGLGVGDELVALGTMVRTPRSQKPRVAIDRNDLAGTISRQNRADWDQAMGPQRGLEDDFASRRPNIAAFARGTGMAATAALPAGGQANLFAQGSRAANMARGAVLAGSQAAVYAAADRGTARERLDAASRAARDPVTLALGAGGGALATAPKPRAKLARPPSLDQLTTQRKAAYAAVEGSGHRYSAKDFSGLVSDIKARLAKEQFDGDFQPKVQLMLDRLDAKAKGGYAPTLSEMDELRKFVDKNVSGDRNTIRLGGVIRKSIDDFIDSQGGGAADLVNTARGLYKRESKVREVTKAVTKAERQAMRTGSGGNANNAIRAKMDSILEKNPYLTDEERAALEEIVVGSRAQNALRQVGKLSPQGNGLMLAGHMAALVPTGGTSAIVAGAGAAAKHAADNMTRQKVTQLIDLMAAGGTREQLMAATKAARSIEGPAGTAVRRLLAAKLSRAAGVAGGARAAEQPNYFARP